MTTKLLPFEDFTKRPRHELHGCVILCDDLVKYLDRLLNPRFLFLVLVLVFSRQIEVNKI